MMNGTAVNIYKCVMTLEYRVPRLCCQMFCRTQQMFINLNKMSRT